MSNLPLEAKNKKEKRRERGNIHKISLVMSVAMILYNSSKQSAELLE
jgi:hypothetical protein